MLCRSSEEAGKMIERYKMFQYKPADAIMEKKEADPYMRVRFLFSFDKFFFLNSYKIYEE